MVKQNYTNLVFGLGSNHVLGCESFLWVGGNLASSQSLGFERVFEVGMVAPNFTNLVVCIGLKSCCGL